MLYVLLATNPNDANTLVSSLKALLVQQEFYSIKKCTVIGLLGVSLLLPSVTGIQYSLKRQTEIRRLQWAYCCVPYLIIIADKVKVKVKFKLIMWLDG